MDNVKKMERNESKGEKNPQHKSYTLARTIRVYREEMKLRARVQHIEEQSMAERRELQYVKMRLNLIENAIKNMV